jgi:hypothetical protein
MGRHANDALGFQSHCGFDLSVAVMHGHTPEVEKSSKNPAPMAIGIGPVNAGGNPIPRRLPRHFQRLRRRAVG